VVVLSDRLWRDRYGADQAILGRQLTIDEQPHTIVGVARPNLRFPDDRVLFWVPNAIARMRTILFGVTPLDGLTFAAAPLVLIAAATLACARPAFRAASTDLALALRAE
jgi:hypothetical protein